MEVCFLRFQKIQEEEIFAFLSRKLIGFRGSMTNAKHITIVKETKRKTLKITAGLSSFIAHIIRYFVAFIKKWHEILRCVI